MATYKDVMKWVAELDVSGAVKGFNRLESEGKKSLNNVAGEADKVEGKFGGMPDKFKGIGGKIGAGMASGFAAIGVGALMAEALQSSWERAGGLRRIEGQFRLSADEAAKYGKLAGDLYAEGWGESVVEVQQVVALTGQRLEDATGRTLDNITAQIIAVSDTWGEDYQAIIRSITQLTQNDLADSSQEALDLIVTGFQDGANEAGDFLDTIDEYSQQFGGMGLSGEDALNIIIAGLQNGQRDTDKLADAVKEMRIRVVEDTDAITEAYETLGFNADETREKFLEGGPAAREAYLEVLAALDSVEDPIEKNRLAVELIGTQFEDLGPTAITSLRTVEGALSDTEGAAQDLADVVGEISPWEELQRQGETTLGRIGDAIAIQVSPKLRDFNDGLEMLGNGFGLFGDDAAEATHVVVDAVTLLGERADQSVSTAIERLQGLTSESTYTADAQDELRMIAGLAADELDDQADSASDAADALDDLRYQSRRSKDELSRLKEEIDDQKSWIGFQETWERINETLNNNETSTRDAYSALLDQKDLVIDYAEETLNLPDEITTRLLADIDEGKQAEVFAFLERLQNGVTLPIRPQVVQSFNARGGPRLTPEGNLVPRAAGATGGIVTRPTFALIGEAGPEAVVPLNTMPGASPLPKMTGGGGNVYNINVTAPAGADADEFGRIVREAIRRETRWSGPVTGWSAA